MSNRLQEWSDAIRHDADASMRLFSPQPIRVLASPAGVPKMVVRLERRARITQIIDVWRIDDEWWREEIRRRYFLLELDDGSDASVFHDLMTGNWYEQRF